MKNLSADSMVKSFQINQATTHVFQDLYMYNTMVILVQSGSKVVRNDKQNAIDAHPGELLIFPSGTYITIENRIISGEDYNAWCVSYPDQYIQSVFPELSQSTNTEPVIHLKECPLELAEMFKSIESVAEDQIIPEQLKIHRLCEPLVWLKSIGVTLFLNKQKSMDRLVRELIATRPDRKWRSGDIAVELGVSQATLRRRLNECKTKFSDILSNVRLEHGLMLLQSTNTPISQIALECGYSSPSHFSDAFKARFDIPPKGIRIFEK